MSAATLPNKVAAAVFPDGQYVVVDPIDIFPADAWHRVVYTILQDDSSATVECDLGGKTRHIFVWTSKHGHGIYPHYQKSVRSDGSDFMEYCGAVEATNGMLCIVSAEAISSTTGLVTYTATGTPSASDDCDVAHGDHEIITSGVVSGDYQTQPWPYEDESPPLSLPPGSGGT